MRIRTAGPEDIFAVINLSDFAFGKGFLKPEHFGEADFYVAVQDNKIVGFACIEMDAGTCLIDQVAVDPDHRREGIAKQLIEHIINDIDAEMFESHAWEYSDTKKVPLASPLEQCGFERIKYLKHIYKDEHGDESPCSVCGTGCVCSAWLYCRQ